MTIQFEPIDKKFIKHTIECPSHMRGYYKRTKQKPTIFNKVVKISIEPKSAYFYVMVEENDDRRRPEACSLNLNTLNELHKKYYILNISPSEHGMLIHLQRTIWNACDKCSMTIWLDKKGKLTKDFSSVHSFFNNSLCDKCWKKLAKSKKKEYQIAWKNFIESDGKPKTKAVRDYFKLEKRYEIR